MSTHIVELPVMVLLQVLVFGVVQVFLVVRSNAFIFACFAAIQLVSLVHTESFFATRANSNFLSGIRRKIRVVEIKEDIFIRVFYRIDWKDSTV